MKTEIKEKILSLLDTKNQTSRLLIAPKEILNKETIESEACFCIQGIFALAIGGEVTLTDTKRLAIEIEGLKLRRVLPWQILSKVDIPLELNPRFILDNLQLDEISINRLQLLERSNLTVQWIELNDCYLL